MNSNPQTCESSPWRGKSLWVFAPGLGLAARAGSRRYPALERLVARGRRAPPGRDPWGTLAGLLGGGTGPWPVGPVSLLGDGGRPSGNTLRVEPLGMDGQGAFRIPAARLGVTGAEARALAGRFDEILGEGAMRMHVPAPGRWYLEGVPGWAGAADRCPRGFRPPSLRS